MELRLSCYDEVEIVLLCCNLDVIEKGYLIVETRSTV